MPAHMPDRHGACKSMRSTMIGMSMCHCSVMAMMQIAIHPVCLFRVQVMWESEAFKASRCEAVACGSEALMRFMGMLALTSEALVEDLSPSFLASAAARACSACMCPSSREKNSPKHSCQACTCIHTAASFSRGWMHNALQKVKMVNLHVSQSQGWQ